MHGATAEQMLSTHIAGINDLFARCHLTLSQLLLDARQPGIIGGRRWRGGDIREQIGQVIIAGFGQMHLITGPFSIALSAVARIAVVGRADQDGGRRRDHGWTPPLPAPRADAPEMLGPYFASLAAELDSEGRIEQADVQPPVALPHVFPISAAPPPPAKVGPAPWLTDVWQDTLAGLRLRLPREVYQNCVRQATLVSCVDGIVTIVVSNARLKDTRVVRPPGIACALFLMQRGNPFHMPLTPAA